MWTLPQRLICVDVKMIQQLLICEAVLSEMNNGTPKDWKLQETLKAGEKKVINDSVVDW